MRILWSAEYVCYSFILMWFEHPEYEKLLSVISTEEFLKIHKVHKGFKNCISLQFFMQVKRLNKGISIDFYTQACR